MVLAQPTYSEAKLKDTKLRRLTPYVGRLKHLEPCALLCVHQTTTLRLQQNWHSTRFVNRVTHESNLTLATGFPFGYKQSSFYGRHVEIEGAPNAFSI